MLNLLELSMGLNFNLVNYLLSKKIFEPNSINFSKILQIGVLKNSMTRNQKIYLADRYEVPRSLLDKNADQLYAYFGFKNVTSLDNDKFENANFMKNLNIPPGDEDADNKDQFDLIIDGGTSEHVINPVVAFANYMNYLKPNGHLIQFLPVNNYIDHGLYQFSPTFFWSIGIQNQKSFELLDLHFKYHGPKVYNYFWDGQSQMFRSHIDGLWDGSTMANLFRYTNKDVIAIANWTKTNSINFNELITNTHQEIYLNQWKNVVKPDTLSQRSFYRWVLPHIYKYRTQFHVSMLSKFVLWMSKQID